MRLRHLSGDLPPLMRKRSASNPIYRRGGRPAISSLRSFAAEQIVKEQNSSDSEEESQQDFLTGRKREWAERKRMYRSTSAGKIAKEAPPVVDETSAGRRRHFSADSPRKLRTEKLLHVYRKVTHCVGLKRGKEAGKKDAGGKGKKGSKGKKCDNEKNGANGVSEVVGERESESSENPHSSHSEVDSTSDLLPSESEVDARRDTGVCDWDSEDDTRLDTVCNSLASDRTLDNEVFASLDSGTELGSSTEVLQNSPLRWNDLPSSLPSSLSYLPLQQISPLRRGSVANVPPSIDEEQDSRTFEASIPETCAAGGCSQEFVKSLFPPNISINDHMCENTHHNSVLTPSTCSHSMMNSAHCSDRPVSSGPDVLSVADQSDGMKSRTTTTPVSTPQQVRRFKVTFVKSDSSSLQSE